MREWCNARVNVHARMKRVAREMDTDAQPRILMCPPDFYGIEYEINPWMSRSRGQTRQRPSSNGVRLHETLVQLGVQSN